MTVDDVRREREAREARAKEVAATMPPGDYYADDIYVRRHGDRAIMHACSTHWDACLVMMAAPKIEPDAYGRTGEMEDCMACGGSGVEYGETCVTCGGFGWVRA